LSAKAQRAAPPAQCIALVILQQFSPNFFTCSPNLLYLASLLQMSLSNERIAYKQRAFEILAHETHFYNVLDLTLSLNSIFGLFHCFFTL